MKVLVKKEFFTDLTRLQLNDPTCNMFTQNLVRIRKTFNFSLIIYFQVDYDDTYFIAQTGLDDCGTTVEVRDSDIIFTNTLYDNIAKAKDELSGSWIRIDPIVTLKFSCLYKTVVDVDNTISVQPNFLAGSSNGRGNFHFELQTFSDPEFTIEQTTGFKTGEVMYFDVTIDHVVSGVQFSGISLKPLTKSRVLTA